MDEIISEHLAELLTALASAGIAALIRWIEKGKINRKHKKELYSAVTETRNGIH